MKRMWYSGNNDSGIEVDAHSWIVMRQYAHSNREFMGEFTSALEAQAEVNRLRQEAYEEHAYRRDQGFDDLPPIVDVWFSHASKCSVEVTA